MSRLYFHTPERTAELLGREVAHIELLAINTALAILSPRIELPNGAAWARSVTVASYDLFDPCFRAERWVIWFAAAAENSGIRVGNEIIRTFDLALNTLIATESPTAMLVARLAGCGPRHAWIAAEDAAWFADLIDDGRRTDVLRANCGWESVAQLARAVASGLPGPIVTSHTTYATFPDREIIGRPWFYPSAQDSNGEDLPNELDREANERWRQLPDHDRWHLAVSAIQARTHTRQLSPTTIAERYQCGASAMDLIAATPPGLAH